MYHKIRAKVVYVFWVKSEANLSLPDDQVSKIDFESDNSYRRTELEIIGAETEEPDSPYFDLQDPAWQVEKYPTDNTIGNSIYESIEEVMEQEEAGWFELDCGCVVEPDGICPCGNSSPLLTLGMI